jgi:hypothetical protein
MLRKLAPREFRLERGDFSRHVVRGRFPRTHEPFPYPKPSFGTKHREPKSNKYENNEKTPFGHGFELVGR